MIFYLQSMLFFFCYWGTPTVHFQNIFSLFFRSHIYHVSQGFATPGRNIRKERSRRRRRKLVTRAIGFQGTRKWRSGLLLKTESAPNAREVFCRVSFSPHCDLRGVHFPCQTHLSTTTACDLSKHLQLPVLSIWYTPQFLILPHPAFFTFSSIGHPTVTLKCKSWTPDTKIPEKPGDIAGAVLMPWRCPHKGSNPVQLANDWVVCFLVPTCGHRGFNFHLYSLKKKCFWIWAISNIWILVFKWL